MKLASNLSVLDVSELLHLKTSGKGIIFVITAIMRKYLEINTSKDGMKI